MLVQKRVRGNSVRSLYDGILEATGEARRMSGIGVIGGVGGAGASHVLPTGRGRRKQMEVAATVALSAERRAAAESGDEGFAAKSRVVAAALAGAELRLNILRRDYLHRCERLQLSTVGLQHMATTLKLQPSGAWQELGTLGGTTTPMFDDEQALARELEPPSAASRTAPAEYVPRAEALEALMAAVLQRLSEVASGAAHAGPLEHLLAQQALDQQGFSGVMRRPAGSTAAASAADGDDGGGGGGGGGGGVGGRRRTGLAGASGGRSSSRLMDSVDRTVVSTVVSKRSSVATVVDASRRVAGASGAAEGVGVGPFDDADSVGGGGYDDDDADVGGDGDDDGEVPLGREQRKAASVRFIVKRIKKDSPPKVRTAQQQALDRQHELDSRLAETGATLRGKLGDVAESERVSGLAATSDAASVIAANSMRVAHQMHSHPCQHHRTTPGQPAASMGYNERVYAAQSRTRFHPTNLAPQTNVDPDDDAVFDEGAARRFSRPIVRG